MLLQVLDARIAAARHPGITEERRAAWRAGLASVITPFSDAVAALRTAEGNETVSAAAVRDAAAAVASALGRLKRDLKNMSLTEADIHSIIPDARRADPHGDREPAESATAPASGSPTGETAPPPAQAARSPLRVAWPRLTSPWTSLRSTSARVTRP